MVIRRRQLIHTARSAGQQKRRGPSPVRADAAATGTSARRAQADDCRPIPTFLALFDQRKSYRRAPDCSIIGFFARGRATGDSRVSGKFPNFIGVCARRCRHALLKAPAALRTTMPRARLALFTRLARGTSMMPPSRAQPLPAFRAMARADITLPPRRRDASHAHLSIITLPFLKCDDMICARRRCRFSPPRTLTMKKAAEPPGHTTGHAISAAYRALSAMMQAFYSSTPGMPPRAMRAYDMFPGRQAVSPRAAFSPTPAIFKLLWRA